MSINCLINTLWFNHTDELMVLPLPPVTVTHPDTFSSQSSQDCALIHAK